MNVTGTTAIVTGAAGGIGAAIAAELAAQGVAVVGVDVHPGVTVRGDIRDDATLEAIFAAASSLEAPASILVNCAFWEERAPLLEVTAAGWAATLDVSLTAAMRWSG